MTVHRLRTNRHWRVLHSFVGPGANCFQKRNILHSYKAETTRLLYSDSHLHKGRYTCSMHPKLVAIEPATLSWKKNDNNIFLRIRLMYKCGVDAPWIVLIQCPFPISIRIMKIRIDMKTQNVIFVLSYCSSH